LLGLGELQGGMVLPLVRTAEAEMRGDVTALAAMITEQIHNACPDLPAGLHDGTYASTLSNIDAFFGAIREGTDPASIPAPTEAQAYARALARSGLDLELLTRAYRHGEHAYSQMWKEQLRRSAGDPDSFAEAAMYVDQWLFQYISSVTRSLAVEHADEHERHSSPALVLALNEVRKILSGAQIDQTVSSQRLRYRLDGWHTSFVLWHEGGAPESEDSLEELGRLAAATGAALGATNTLALALGDVYAGWANVSAAGPAVSVTYPDGLRAAVGLPHRGPEGFRRTHQEALKARQVAILAGIEGRTVSFADVALDALLTTDLAEANRFVVRELGELADRSGPRERIVETLEAYLSAGSSLARVSRQLGVHENTVAYRIRRAEEILGRRIDEHPMELQAALRLARLLHPAT
jgi:DNA-binding PucR family transcriptional regulator